MGLSVDPVGAKAQATVAIAAANATPNSRAMGRRRAIDDRL